MTTQKIVLAARCGVRVMATTKQTTTRLFSIHPRQSKGGEAPKGATIHWPRSTSKRCRSSVPGRGSEPTPPSPACGGGKGGGRSPSGASPRRSRTRPNVSTQPRPRFTPASGCGRYPHHDWRLSEAPRAPILLPAGSMPGPPGRGAHILRPQEPHPLRLPKVPSRKASLDRAGCHRM